MLTAQVERYILLRQTLGYKLREQSLYLHAFARFAENRGDIHILASTAVDWSMGHADIASTYWYLNATPELMTGIAVAAEALIAREDL